MVVIALKNFGKCRLIQSPEIGQTKNSEIQLILCKLKNGFKKISSDAANLALEVGFRQNI